MFTLKHILTGGSEQCARLHAAKGPLVTEIRERVSIMIHHLLHEHDRKYSGGYQDKHATNEL